MHPVIEHVQRVLGWQREDSTEAKLDKLEQALKPTSLPVEETVPLFAALLSLSIPEDRYPALTLSPQRQRQLTQDTLVTWMLEEAERQPILTVWEDIHWADPSTQELLGLFIEQTPTVQMLNVLAYRPEFVPPWSMQSHMTPITLNRLERAHIEALVGRLAGEKILPTEVVEHIVGKTDGVPLYVEELTKMLLESDLLEEESDQYILTGSLSSASIPATLQDSLMARLDSLPGVREVAQLGAVLGREFDYEMLQALNAIDEPTLKAGLSQLVAHELLDQRGRIPRAKFIFRHALIRDAAYASLLRRTRQQYHKQVAQLLESRFPDVVQSQPELVAHHYMEAGCAEQAIDYWHKAGERSSGRSNYQEAISHLTTGLSLLQTLPETQERHQQELPLQTALGTASLMVRGQTAPEVETAYARARFLCQQMGDAQDVFLVLFGLWRFYNARANFPLARQLGEELLSIAK
jgi:predicted ATPase